LETGTRNKVALGVYPDMKNGFIAHLLKQVSGSSAQPTTLGPKGKINPKITEINTSETYQTGRLTT
jgi:hypothetical protein